MVPSSSPTSSSPSTIAYEVEPMCEPVIRVTASSRKLRAHSMTLSPRTLL
ncbi:Uncharacterised protein [Mycobacteroides abscessus subsp. abscessus]|nr:Uncharacterised protein [Mycobacteroides abscessus subsp. abscessus]